MTFRMAIIFVAAIGLLQAFSHNCRGLDLEGDAAANTQVRLAMDEFKNARKQPSKSRPSVADCYKKLFESIGPNGVSALQSHRHTGIAIQAAWEETAMTAPPADRPSSPSSPDSEKLAWFLSFVEGRARVTAPEWWKESVRGAKVNRVYRVGSAAWPKAPLYHHFSMIDGKPISNIIADQDSESWRNEASAPLDTRLLRRDGSITIEIGSDVATVPDLFFDCGRISCLLTKTACYLAPHHHAGDSFELFSVDRATGELSWKSNVVATNWGSLTSGKHDMWVTITEQDHRLVVFGASTTGVFVEAFRPDDGGNLFRFSSSN